MSDPLACVSPENASRATPEPLASFAPDAGPNQTTLGCTASPEPPRPTKPCDAKNLKVTVFEIEGGSQGHLNFETLKAAAGIDSQRPRDGPPPPGAPAHIRSQLAGYDLVIEALGVEPGRSAPAPINDERPTRNAFDRNRQRDARDPAAVAGKATVKATGMWDARCGDRAHAGLSFDRHDGHGATAEPASFVHEIPCKPVRAILDRLDDFVLSGLDPRMLGQPYEVVCPSCGVTPAGPATTDLKALVTAFPAGETGIKLSFGPLPFEIGWGLGEAANAAALKAARGEAADAGGALQAEIDRMQATGAKWEAKKDRGSRKQRKKRRLNIKRNAAAQAGLQEKLAEVERKLAEMEREAEGPDDGTLFDVAAVIFGREVASEDLERVQDAAEAIKAKLDTAQRLMGQIRAVLRFVSDYSPSLVQPTASIKAEFCLVDLFAGVKMTGSDALQGPRHRALARFWDVELTISLVQLTGSLGITFGKRILGTGATAEALVTIKASIGLDAEYKTLFGPGDEDDSWKSKTEVKFIPELTAKAAFIGAVSFIYFHIAYISFDVAGAARFRCSATLADALECKFKSVVVLDPVVGGCDVSLVFGLWTERHEYKVWEGKTWELG